MKVTPRAFLILALPVFLLYGCERAAFVDDSAGDGTTPGTTPTVPNTAPVARITSVPAGTTSGSTLTVGSPVTLTGATSTDADGDTLTYAWTVTAPTGSTVPASGQSVEISTTLDVTGEYTFELIVNDGTTNSTAASFTLIAGAEPNAAPIADLGSTSFADGAHLASATPITLDGAASNDLDPGDSIKTFVWTVTDELGNAVAGTPTATPSTTGSTFSFTPTSDGAHDIELVVTDQTDTPSNPVTWTIYVGVPEAVLTVNGSATDITVAAGAVVTLDGTGSSDPDASAGDLITYSFTGTDPNGADVVFSVPTPETREATLDTVGVYNFTLVVTDSHGNDSLPDSVSVTVQ